MAFYENVFIARQDISAQQAEALAAEFTEIVKNNGGSVVRQESWGLRSLTYRVKKNRKGHYVMLSLDCPPAALRELERNQRINEDVIRFLTVRVEALEEGPSAMLQSRDRNDRGDRGDRPRRDGERGDRGDRGDRGPRPPRADRAPREMGAEEA
ncbi:MAG: 30S ribosomal protein S6 [Alphaproteobacteria bacterium]|nr:30S ribosomal protein S6 [Alphaproteobacteria bacterium]